MNNGFIAAISVLTAIFFGSLLVLILVVKKKFCKTFDLLSEYHRTDHTLDQNLVDNMEVPCDSIPDLELGEVSPRIEEQCANNDWRSSIVDLMPHCLRILKTTRLLTDTVIKHVLMESREVQFPETLADLVHLAKGIGIRVDEVVKSMYPPLDPRLLEARCSALVLLVNNMVLLMKSASFYMDRAEWMDQAMLYVQEDLKVLRETSMSYEKQLSFPECSQMLGAIKEVVDEELIDFKTHQCLISSSSV